MNSNGYNNKTNGTNGNCNGNGFINGDYSHGAKSNRSTYEDIMETVDYLLDRIPRKPTIGIICGSGMGGLADTLQEPVRFPYETVPHFPVSTVTGHMGQLVFGYLGDAYVVCMQGRFHYYEGYPLWKCSMPVRVMKMLGCNQLVASNAAGGINTDFKIGDVMIIKDHINFMSFAGNNPLLGDNDERFGPRFVPMDEPYNLSLIKKVQEIAKDLGIDDNVKEGVYTCLGGPCFETVAELRMLKMCGVDAVGMSTVHEVITAKHCGMNCFAFSLITNVYHSLEYNQCDSPNHEEVMDVGKKRESEVQKFVTSVVQYINDNYCQKAKNGSA